MLAALLMAGCATTEDKQAQVDRDALGSVLDTDKDGKITQEEFMAKTSDKAKGLEVYEQCDTSKKGYLTYDEFWSRAHDASTGTNQPHAAPGPAGPAGAVERLTIGGPGTRVPAGR